MSLLIRKPGMLSTVQDLGRVGSRRLGINPNGVMDTTAARLINIALGNEENAAVIEMHFPAAEIEFEDDTLIALGGADLGAMLDNVSIPLWQTMFASKGGVLKFKGKVSGNRCYLAVKNGFSIDSWLGSASTNLVAGVGGFEGRKLSVGDRVACATTSEIKKIKIGRSLFPRYSRFPTVRIVAGSELPLLTAVSERAFLSRPFEITTDSNRMGFRLKGEPLQLLQTKEMLSSAVDFGTIQLLPDGQMIVLMTDHQTTGGYPRIGHVIKHDLPLVAQLGAKDTVSFHLISVEQAEAITMEFERELALCKMGIRLTNLGGDSV